MFHIKYPANKTFLTWEELGCLCRALGLPTDLFQGGLRSDISDIKQDEKGLEVKTILRMFEMNLLKDVLHRTYNMHTADWNARAITRAMYILGHRFLTFDGVYSVRVAYMTYEHPDMKGMTLDRHTLLRALKLAGLVIAPLKLMHIRQRLEERRRLQLHEFFDLILWCEMNFTNSYEDLHGDLGKDGYLFKLADFQNLLSHHDQRVARQLNAQYLKEERDFGMEHLGSKEMFKDPPVNTDFRTGQIQLHKQNYRHLKNEVIQSQKRVYRAHAGSIRPRPISAPALDTYRLKVERQETIDISPLAAFQMIQRRLHSAPLREAQPRVDRPQVPKLQRTEPEHGVDLDDVNSLQNRMANLYFDINTLSTRSEIQKESEMLFYIPRHLEKLANKKSDPETVSAKVSLREPKRKRQHWTIQIIDNLVNPTSNWDSAHSKSCDARYRFRAWKKAHPRCGHVSVERPLMTGDSSAERKLSKTKAPGSASATW